MSVIIFWPVSLIVVISVAGWVGFHMGEQVAIHSIRQLISRFKQPVTLPVFDDESSGYVRGMESAFEIAADMLDELCDKIDP